MNFQKCTPQKIWTWKNKRMVLPNNTYIFELMKIKTQLVYKTTKKKCLWWNKTCFWSTICLHKENPDVWNPSHMGVQSKRNHHGSYWRHHLPESFIKTPFIRTFWLLNWCYKEMKIKNGRKYFCFIEPVIILILLWCYMLNAGLLFNSNPPS